MQIVCCPHSICLKKKRKKKDPSFLHKIVLAHLVKINQPNWNVYFCIPNSMPLINMSVLLPVSHSQLISFFENFGIEMFVSSYLVLLKNEFLISSTPWISMWVLGSLFQFYKEVSWDFVRATLNCWSFEAPNLPFENVKS